MDPRSRPWSMRGRFAEIAAYCERDVVLTYLLWLRFELFSGRLTETSYRASLENLGQYLGTARAAKPHLQDLAMSAVSPVGVAASIAKAS